MSYKCDNCGYKSITKLGICPQCSSIGKMSTIETKKELKQKEKKGIKKGTKIQKQEFKEMVEGVYTITDSEIRRVFGKGIKKGGVYLLGGEPGIGKSTLLMQILGMIKREEKNVNMAYFSGEENENQVEERKKRLGITEDINIYNSSILEDVVATIEEEGYNFVIIDSIQTIESLELDGLAGGMAQVKHACSKLTSYFKQNGITGIIIGHVTKGGEIAGPKYLEHLVDAVVYLEGDRFGLYRFLRAKKNRFGPAEEVGIFSMDEDGLTAIPNYSEQIAKDFIHIPGNVLAIGMDNGRPMVTNIEVIVTQTSYNFPQRKAIGVSKERLELICAIFENKTKKMLSNVDIFLNVPGEIKFKDNGLDLAIYVALYSAIFNKNISNKVFFGELTLMGKVQRTSFHKKRIKEAKNFKVIDYNEIKMIEDIENVL